MIIDSKNNAESNDFMQTRKIKMEKKRNAEAGQNDASSGMDQSGACVVNTDGEKIEFTSRSELEKKIREVSTELSKTIAANYNA